MSDIDASHLERQRAWALANPYLEELLAHVTLVERIEHPFGPAPQLTRGVGDE